MSKFVEELTNKLQGAISTVTTTVDETVKTVEETKKEVESALVVPEEIITQVNEKRSWFHKNRRAHPWEMILGTSFTTALLSAPFGRYTMLRNAFVVGALATVVVAPEKIVDTFHKRSQYYP